MQRAIGLDIGHSAVKVAARVPFLFPTAVMPAVDLTVDIGDDAAAQDTVRVGDRDYFIGDTAVIHSGGRALDALSDDWIDTDEHNALLLGGYQKAVRQFAGGTPQTVALGLPSRLYTAQKERLRASAARLLGFSRDQVIVVPQPMAAFYRYLLTADGMPAAHGDENDKWIVIDIGYYTTDFGFIDREVWSAAGQDSVSGTYVAAQHVRRRVADDLAMDLSIREAEHTLRTQTLRDQGEMIDLHDLVQVATGLVAKSIIDGATRVFGPAAIRGARGVYVAGGGAELLFDAIHATWKHAVRATGPRFAVAEGLRRCALAFGLVEA